MMIKPLRQFCRLSLAKVGMQAFVIIVMMSFLFIGCSITKNLDQGEVYPSDFHVKLGFLTAKSLIVIPCEIDGQAKNFLFDTGAQVTSVQRDSIFGDIVEVRGASNRTVENGSEIIKSFKIGEGLEFKNTFATNENMTFLKGKIPNFGGVLGRTIINKANWLINYPNRTVEISNQNLADDSFINIPLDKEHETPYTDLYINGKQYRAIIDLGSTSVFNVPEGTELAKDLLERYDFQEKERERYTVGGNDTIIELVSIIPKIKISGAEFQNIKVNINKSSQIRLGMRFFKDYIIYIDNDYHRYRFKKFE